MSDSGETTTLCSLLFRAAHEVPPHFFSRQHPQAGLFLIGRRCKRLFRASRPLGRRIFSATNCEKLFFFSLTTPLPPSQLRGKFYEQLPRVHRGDCLAPARIPFLSNDGPGPPPPPQVDFLSSRPVPGTSVLGRPPPFLVTHGKRW